MKIVIIGAGNVATHLARALDRAHSVVQVCARHITSAQRLANSLRGCQAITDPALADPDADFCIIAVSDGQARAVSDALPAMRGIVAHTSGSVGIDALERHPRRGVFYPLQTFSREAEVNVADVPFLIEGSDPETSDALSTLASSISRRVAPATSQVRAQVHVAAVLACNFPNYLWGCAQRLLEDAGLTLDLLRPLLQATLDKAMAIGPDDAQTGPARRGDTEVCESHMRRLPPDVAEIYKLISSSIQKKYNEQN